MLALLLGISFSTLGQTAEDYLKRGLTKQGLRDYQGAISDFTKAIENDPTDARVYKWRGMAKRELKDYRGAIADFSVVIERYPKNANAYFYRGFPKINLKDKNGACLDRSKAGELGASEAYEMIQEYCQ